MERAVEGAELLTKQSRDPFVKNVMAVAGVALKGVPKSLEKKAEVKEAATLAERCHAAHAKITTYSNWESVSAAMLEWRGLSEVGLP